MKGQLPAIARSVSCATKGAEIRVYADVAGKTKCIDPALRFFDISRRCDWCLIVPGGFARQSRPRVNDAAEEENDAAAMVANTEQERAIGGDGDWRLHRPDGTGAHDDRRRGGG